MKGINHHHFLAISLLFGLIYVFMVPPFQAPDEDSHYFRSYEIFNPPSSDKNDPDNRLGGYLPSSLFEYSDQFRYLRFNYEGKISNSQLSTLNEKNLDKVNTSFTDFSNTAMYFPTAYPLQSIFAAIASRINLRPATILYGLRIATLFSWLTILFFAFKLMPGDKKLFLFIATLPSILVLHSSITADAITNALAFFLFAFVMNLRHQKSDISTKQILLFAMLILIISINKLVYFPLVLLWFLLPFGKFGTRLRYYGMFSAVVGVSFAVSMLWSLKVNQAYITYEEYAVEYRHDQQIKPNGHPTKQLEHVLSHPIDFTMNAISSYLSVVPATVAHLTGKFGWEKNYIPAWMVYMLALSLLALILSTKINIQSKERLLFAFIILASLYLLAIVMYGLYSAVGNDYIFNLGGRYLFPILPLFVYVFSTRLLKFEIKHIHLLFVLCLAHTTMIYSILQRYYF